ncbi:hypothetical protein, partial [Burkholderia ubonensis]|uniref:hypothetical protein n=1 Tax=Burkholderia ubonensis TaxID=101571 RepID=UPI0012F95E40
MRDSVKDLAESREQCAPERDVPEGNSHAGFRTEPAGTGVVEEKPEPIGCYSLLVRGRSMRVERVPYRLITVATAAVFLAA